ncbi:MAG: hypothetical protein Q8L46_01645 [candidate division WWE3 bacterium]|nr:hypothetical protein [candidate division WWE3 bacterium]
MLKAVVFDWDGTLADTLSIHYGVICVICAVFTHYEQDTPI